MKIIKWLHAAWISFQVYQNKQRLSFLWDHLRSHENSDDRDHAVTTATYRKILGQFFMDHRLDRIWPLEQAQDLLWRTDTLIDIGEHLLYGTDEFDLASAEAEG